VDGLADDRLGPGGRFGSAPGRPAAKPLRSGSLRNRLGLPVRLADGRVGVEHARSQRRPALLPHARGHRASVRHRPRHRKRGHRPGGGTVPDPHARPLRAATARNLRTTGADMIRTLILTLSLLALTAQVAQAASGADYLASRQALSGGFAEPGGSASVSLTEWAVMGLA